MKPSKKSTCTASTTSGWDKVSYQDARFISAQETIEKNQRAQLRQLPVENRWVTKRQESSLLMKPTKKSMCTASTTSGWEKESYLDVQCVQLQQLPIENRWYSKNKVYIFNNRWVLNGHNLHSFHLILVIVLYNISNCHVSVSRHHLLRLSKFATLLLQRMLIVKSQQVMTLLTISSHRPDWADCGWVRTSDVQINSFQPLWFENHNTKHGSGKLPEWLNIGKTPRMI